MNILKILRTEPGTSTLPTQIQTTSPNPMDASALYWDAQQDDLDGLMAELSAADPAFAGLLAQAGRDLAPLATTREGDITMTSLRMLAGLTQKQLADRIGQKQSNVSLYESGQRTDLTRATMCKLCEALSCDMNTLNQALQNSTQMLEAHLDTQEAAPAEAIGERRNCA